MQQKGRLPYHNTYSWERKGQEEYTELNHLQRGVTYFGQVLKEEKSVRKAETRKRQEKDYASRLHLSVEKKVNTYKE